VLSCYKLKTIQVIKKSLVHAVATLNSNMHIKLQINWIISMGVLYNGDFRNMSSKRMRLKFDTIFKTT